MTACAVGPTTGLVLPVLYPADSFFSEKCCCTRVQLLSQRERWFPPLRFLKNTCRLSDPAAWIVGMRSFSFCTFLAARCVGLYICQIKARGTWREIIVSFSLHLALLPPCCCNGDDNRAAASKQSQSILRLEGQDEGQITTQTPCCTLKGCRSTQTITQTRCSLWHAYYRTSSGGRSIQILNRFM